MRIGYWTPHAGSVVMDHANTMICDYAWMVSNGHTPMLWDEKDHHITYMRNRAAKKALELELDRLMMMDADCAGPRGESVIGRLSEIMDENEAAAVGLAFICGEPNAPDTLAVNVTGSGRPGEVYKGAVGTGAMLIDVARVRQIPAPWFMDEPNEDGTVRRVGQDIYFCNLLAKHGLSVYVDERRPAGVHVKQWAMELVE